MAHYLPVLLVSVNAFYPDDSAVTQRPRNQVDYLSHQWEEEDVWRSWRNMTRQKNEIANGVRLENASWRTWWKQRNKLKTISPETLNWLKDSDVTWLYGPLHTATDGAPPPKTSSDEVGRTTPLEDDEEPCAYEPKPILKHRSISQMLTSDLPSPLYSPPESEEENDHYGGGGGDTNAREMPAPGRSIPTRPPLLHTKSDTHVIRWGPNKRAFRRDSPPRIHASGYSVASSSSATHSRVPRSGSSTNVSAYFAGSDPEQSLRHSHQTHQYHQQQHLYTSNTRNHCTLPRAYSATSLPSQDDASGSSSSNVVHPAPGKRKHISFNTFVEQCIAIDKPKSPPNDWSPKSKGEYDDGYEEDEEDGFDDGSESALISDSDESDLVIREEDEEEENDDGIISMITSRPTRASPAPNDPNSKKRSKSKASTASSSSTSTASSTSSSVSSPYYRPAQMHTRTGQGKQRSQSSLSSRRSPLVQRTASLSDRDKPLTIAPIAPTLLKAGGTPGASISGRWTADGYPFEPPDEGGDFAPSAHFDGWTERVFDEDDAGEDLMLPDYSYQEQFSNKPYYSGHSRGRAGRRDDDEDADGILGSVELVYAPSLPLWNVGYDEALSEDDDEDEVVDALYTKSSRNTSQDEVFRHGGLEGADLPTIEGGMGEVKITPPSPTSGSKQASKQLSTPTGPSSPAVSYANTVNSQWRSSSSRSNPSSSSSSSSTIHPTAASVTDTDIQPHPPPSPGINVPPSNRSQEGVFIHTGAGTSSAYDYFEGPDMGEDLFASTPRPGGNYALASSSGQSSGARAQSNNGARVWNMPQPASAAAPPKRRSSFGGVEAEKPTFSPFPVPAGVEVPAQIARATSSPRATSSASTSRAAPSMESSKSRPSQPKRNTLSPPVDERGRSRSRSRSRSRTPSPRFATWNPQANEYGSSSALSTPSGGKSASPMPVSSSSSPTPTASQAASPGAAINSSSAAPPCPTSPSLLHPPTRGRRSIPIQQSTRRGRGPLESDSLSPPVSSSYQGSSSYSYSSSITEQPNDRRGRSSTRTSSSFSDRERSSMGGKSSPSFGSLSPDGGGNGSGGNNGGRSSGLGVFGSGGGYSSGAGRERERGRRRRGEDGGSESSAAGSLSPGPSSGGSRVAMEEPSSMVGQAIPEEREQEKVAMMGVTPANSPVTISAIPRSLQTSTKAQERPLLQPIRSSSSVVSAPSSSKPRLTSSPVTSSPTASPNPASGSSSQFPTALPSPSLASSHGMMKGSPAPMNISSHARTPSISSPTVNPPSAAGEMTVSSSEPVRTSSADSVTPRSGINESQRSKQQQNGIMGKAAGIVGAAGALFGLWQQDQAAVGAQGKQGS